MNARLPLAIVLSLGFAAANLTGADDKAVPAVSGSRVFEEGDLVQGSGAVFLIRDGMCRGIPNMDVFKSYGFDGGDVIHVSDQELRAIPHGPVLAMAKPGETGPQGDAFPRLTGPGQQVAMDRLGELFLLPKGPKTPATFELPYLMPSVLWPATGPGTNASAMRRYYRVALLERKIDDDGYVTTNQHRGHAHADGWPFPTWVQAGGAGWLFSHAGDPYAKDFKIPLLASLAGWDTHATAVVAHDPNTGLQLDLGSHASLATPACNVDTLATPFIAIEWNGTLPAGAQPFLAWTTAAAPEFDAARRIGFNPVPPAAAWGHERRTTMIAAYRHPLWTGRITRLRVEFGNPTPARVSLRGLHTAVDSRHPVNNPHWLEACVDYFDWTTDVAFLRENLARMRRATDFAVREFGLAANGVAVVPWVGHDGRAGFTIDAKRKTSFPGRGVGNNYWDLLPFGGQDAFLTITLFHALKRVADLEEQIAAHPEWDVPPQPGRAETLRGCVARLQSEGSRKFWDAPHGRFVGWIDRDGVARDYGFTFLNLEAVRYGFANDVQAKAIMDWIPGRRVIDGDPARGRGKYHLRVGPRGPQDGVTIVFFPRAAAVVAVGDALAAAGAGVQRRRRQVGGSEGRIPRRARCRSGIPPAGNGWPRQR